MTVYAQALAGRRVVDASQYIAGPLCSQLLADFGAEVIKVEPVGGDPSRAFHGTRHGSAYFRAYNTDKASRALDLSVPDGRAVLDEMLESADALVMNFTSRALERLDLTWDVLHAQHPHLVVANLTGFGRGDPRVCFDSIAQAESGYAALNADADGAPRVTTGYPTDLFSGLYGALAVAMALCDPRPRGVSIDVAMIDVAMAALCGPALLLAAECADVPVAAGNRDTTTCPSTVFACADGYCYLYAGVDKHWERLRALVGGPDLSAAERLSAPEAVERVVADWTRGRTVAAVCAQMSELGIPAGVVRYPGDALAHLRAATGDSVISLRDNGEAVVELPVLVDGNRPARRPAPSLGSPGTAPPAVPGEVHS